MLYNNNQWITLFSNGLKTFLHSPGPEQRNKVCETDSHVELLTKWMIQNKEQKQHDGFSKFIRKLAVHNWLG